MVSYSQFQELGLGGGIGLDWTLFHPVQLGLVAFAMEQQKQTPWLSPIISRPVCPADVLHFASVNSVNGSCDATSPSNDSALKSAAVVSSTNVSLPARRQLLVCHDMRGNYLEDRFDLGSGYDNAFQLFHWDLVDIFCYFSHNFITVPPRQWIQACRRHSTDRSNDAVGSGPLVLGTLITEWDAGKDICAQFFDTEAAVQGLVSYLLHISTQEGIDGWLINIENELTETQVSNMLVFLRQLTKGMRAINACSKVIWLVCWCLFVLSPNIIVE
jgi:hypothetical protein